MTRDEKLDAVFRVFSDNWPALHSITARYLKIEEDREDALQDAALSLTKYIDRIRVDDETELKGYISVTVKNSALRLAEKRRAESERASDEEPDAVVSELFPSPSPEDRAIASEDARKLLENCDEAELELLYDRFVLSMPVREIADKMGWQLGRAKMRLKRLTDRLVKGGEDDDTVRN